MDDNDSQMGGVANPMATDRSLAEKNKEALEQILNIEMLSQPPFSMVNLTENLVPLNLNSKMEDLVSIIEQYKENEQGLEILEVTLKNLSGNAPDAPAFGWKWAMINNNQMWAKKLWVLIDELMTDEPKLFAEFKCLRLLKDDVLEEFLGEQKDDDLDDDDEDDD